MVLHKMSPKISDPHVSSGSTQILSKDVILEEGCWVFVGISILEQSDNTEQLLMFWPLPAAAAVIPVHGRHGQLAVLVQRLLAVPQLLLFLGKVVFHTKQFSKNTPFQCRYNSGDVILAPFDHLKS